MGRRLVFVIGDSISQHYGPHLQEMLSPMLDYARKTGEEPQLTGTSLEPNANGGDSAAVLAYLEAMIRGGGFGPDVLLINCGLHDIKTDPQTGARQVLLEQYRSNLKRIVELAQAAARKLIWVRTTPVDDERHNSISTAFYRYAADVDACNAAADEIMSAAGVPAIDLHAFTVSLGDEVFCDHVHFTEPVRRLQAAFIAGYLNGRR